MDWFKGIVYFGEPHDLNMGKFRWFFPVSIFLYTNPLRMLLRKFVFLWLLDILLGISFCWMVLNDCWLSISQSGSGAWFFAEPKNWNGNAMLEPCNPGTVNLFGLQNSSNSSIALWTLFVKSYNRAESFIPLFFENSVRTELKWDGFL